MLVFPRLYVVILTVLFRLVRLCGGSKADLVLENVAFRHQVEVLKRGRPRSSLTWADRALWVLLRRWWPRWREALEIVGPQLHAHVESSVTCFVVGTAALVGSRGSLRAESSPDHPLSEGKMLRGRELAKDTTPLPLRTFGRSMLNVAGRRAPCAGSWNWT